MKTYLYGALVFGLVLTSCKSDDIVPSEGDSALEITGTYYVSMSIKGDDSQTRASSDNGTPVDGTDFEVGTGTENSVNNAYFVFYDEDGNVVGDIVPVELNDSNIETVPSGNTVEKSYKSVVSVSVRKGEKKPTQVICYINPISPSTLRSNLDIIQTISRSTVHTTVENAKYFAMSNSVYYPEGEAEGSTPQVAVKVPDNALFTDENAAESALADVTGANVVKIYVERYATKLTFEAKDPSVYSTATRVYKEDGTYDIVPVSLTFTPQFWAVNAESNRSYVIKSFRQESEDGALLPDNYTYGMLDARINPAVAGTYDGSKLNSTNGWDWNNPDYHRSYWGISPAYFQSRYPEVASDLDDMPEINQTYITYNQLVNHQAGYAAANPATKTQYFKETTVGSNALASKNPAAAVASVIYVGKYGVKVNGVAAPANSGFYSYLTGPVNGVEDDRPYVYFENVENSAASKVPGGESMLKRFLAQCTILYRAVTDENNNVSYQRLVVGEPEDLTALSAALAVDEISKKVKEAGSNDEEPIIKLQANARSLQFKSAAAAAGIYILTGNGYKEIVSDDVTPNNDQITLTSANYTLFRTVGCAYYYTSGHAYFNIPVRHLGWYRKGNENNDPNAKFDWNKVRVGDFGMVRNHSYSVDVTKINGLASGIGGDDIPIIPPAGSVDYFVAYSVRILKWVVVPTQKVEL